MATLKEMVREALKNAIENGDEEELREMGRMELAEDLARCDADIERHLDTNYISVEVLAGVAQKVLEELP